jgi:hypothetical protein
MSRNDRGHGSHGRRRRDADDAEERRGFEPQTPRHGDRAAGAIDADMNASRLRKMLGQRAHSHREAIPAPVLRQLHRQDFDNEFVARQRTLDRDRTGHEMRPLARRDTGEHGAMFGKHGEAGICRRNLVRVA